MPNKPNEYDLVAMRISMKTNVYDKLFKQSKKLGISANMLIRIILTQYTDNGMTIALNGLSKKVVK